MIKLYEWFSTKLLIFKTKNGILFERIFFLLLSIILFVVSYFHENIFSHYPSPHVREADNITGLLLRIPAFISLGCFIISILYARIKK